MRTRTRSHTTYTLKLHFLSILSFRTHLVEFYLISVGFTQRYLCCGKVVPWTVCVCFCQTCFWFQTYFIWWRKKLHIYWCDECQCKCACIRMYVLVCLFFTSSSSFLNNNFQAKMLSKCLFFVSLKLCFVLCNLWHYL